MSTQAFGRRELALAYANAQNTRVSGVDAERAGYDSALREYRNSLLAGLERLFGLRLDFAAMSGGMSPVFMAFRSTVHSYLAITGPMDGHLEAGLLHNRLEEAGVHESFLSGIGRIAEINAESRAAHLDLLDVMLGVLLGAGAERVVSVEELHAIGVGTTPPDPSDYDWA